MPLNLTSHMHGSSLFSCWFPLFLGFSIGESSVYNDITSIVPIDQVVQGPYVWSVKLMCSNTTHCYIWTSYLSSCFKRWFWRILFWHVTCEEERKRWKRLRLLLWSTRWLICCSYWFLLYKVSPQYIYNIDLCFTSFN